MFQVICQTLTLQSPTYIITTLECPMVPLYTEREHHPNLFLALEPNAGMSYPSMSGMRVPSTVLKRVAPYIYSTPLILFNCIMFHIEHDGHASMHVGGRTVVRLDHSATPNMGNRPLRTISLELHVSCFIVIFIL